MTLLQSVSNSSYVIQNIFTASILYNTACNPRKAYLTFETDLLLLNTGSNQDPQFDQNKTIKKLYIKTFAALF